MRVVRHGIFSVGYDVHVPEGASKEEIDDIVEDYDEWDITDGEWETHHLKIADSKAW